MPLVEHPRVVKDHVELEVDPKGWVKQVLVVETTLPLSEREQGYDPTAFKALIEAVKSAALALPAIRATVRKAQ